MDRVGLGWADPIVRSILVPLLLRLSKKIARTADALLSLSRISHFDSPPAPGRPDAD
jgi:hypothetical protein